MRQWQELTREQAMLDGANTNFDELAMDFASPNEEKPATAGSQAGEDLQPVADYFPML